MDDADEALSVAKHVTDAGAHDVSALLYRATARWAPNRPEAWAGLARELAAASSDPKDQQLVLVALRRARELAPGDAKYRAELALRRQRAPASPAGRRVAPEAGDDERWLAPIATILARRKGVPEKGAAGRRRSRAPLVACSSHACRQPRLAADPVRPRDRDPAAHAAGALRADPARGRRHRDPPARVHRKAGGIAFPVEEHNDGARPRIRWPELEAGDTVEVVIRQWTSTAVGGRGDAPFYFMDYAGSTASPPPPLQRGGRRVAAGPRRCTSTCSTTSSRPTRRPRPTSAACTSSTSSGTSRSVIPEEPLIPQLTEITPVIVGSTFKTWDEFRKWYAEAVRGFTEPDDEVRRARRGAHQGQDARARRSSARSSSSSPTTSATSTTSSGEWWLPNRPQQLLARREGDCDDKAMLLITLLRSVGIEAQEVMVQTRMTGQPSVLLSKNAAVPMFDHGIAFLPGPGGGQYLDATSPQSRLGPIPSMDARAVALRMDTGRPRSWSCPRARRTITART